MGSVSGKSPEEYRGEQIVRATCSLATLLNTVLFIGIASWVLLHANDSFFFLLAQLYRGVVIEVSFVKHSNVGYVCERNSVLDGVFCQENPNESDIICGKRG